MVWEKYKTCKDIKKHLVKNMSCLKVSGQMVSIVAFSIFFTYFKMGNNHFSTCLSRASVFFWILFVVKRILEKMFLPPFVDLLNSIASRNVWKLLYHIYKRLPKPFFKNAIYLVPTFETYINLGLKSTRRGLFVRIIHKFGPQVDPQGPFLAE